jgi:hypothetical protein
VFKENPRIAVVNRAVAMNFSFYSPQSRRLLWQLPAISSQSRRESHRGSYVF